MKDLVFCKSKSLALQPAALALHGLATQDLSLGLAVHGIGLDLVPCGLVLLTSVIRGTQKLWQSGVAGVW